MKQIMWVAICFLLSISPAYSDKQAITEEGETVILKSDGTWVIKSKAKIKASNKVFRDANWGMSKPKVKSTEKGKPIKEDDSILAYSGKVAGMDALIIYIFVENKLVRAKYLFVEKHSNRDDYITDYNNLKNSLEKKYGKPKEDKSVWRNDLYRDDSSRWGFAVSLGHLLYYSQWGTSGTDISLILSGENYKTQLQAEYSSKALEALEDKVREQERASEL